MGGPPDLTLAAARPRNRRRAARTCGQEPRGAFSDGVC